MYDLLSHTYVDAFVEGQQVSNEQRALNRMIDRTNILSAIVLADRGYESYNCFAHIQEKGWKFLFRVKDGTGGITSGLDLPITEEFDLCFNMYLTKALGNRDFFTKTQILDRAITFSCKKGGVHLSGNFCSNDYVQLYRNDYLTRDFRK